MASIELKAALGCVAGVHRSDASLIEPCGRGRVPASMTGHKRGGLVLVPKTRPPSQHSASLGPEAKHQPRFRMQGMEWPQPGDEDGVLPSSQVQALTRAKSSLLFFCDLYFSCFVARFPQLCRSVLSFASQRVGSNQGGQKNGRASWRQRLQRSFLKEGLEDPAL